MKKAFYPLIAAILLLTSAKLAINTIDYSVGKDFKVKFTSKDPSGEFKKMIGNIQYDAKNLAGSSFNFKIEVSSISTGNNMKNKKAMTNEWFAADKHPNITFISSKVVKTEKGIYVHGKLNMKGVDRFRKIKINPIKTDTGMKFTGTFWVDRSYYKIGKTSKAVPNKLKIEFSIPVTKK